MGRTARSHSGVKWDEANLARNHEDALVANRTKIEEPKTPFHRPAEASDDQQLDMPDMLLNEPQSPSQATEQQQSQQTQIKPAQSPSSDTNNFRHARREHYRAEVPKGGLAALRANFLADYAGD